MKTFLVLISLVWLLSCSNENIEDESCPITIDSVSIVDSMEVEGINYYLVYRISGWSDKTEILELYDAEPIFDHCANSDTKPIFGDSLSLSHKVRHVYLNTKERTLDIKYMDAQTDNPVPPNFELELK